MSLSHAYAAVIMDAEKNRLGLPAQAGADFVKKLVAFMKSRGHLSLLPQILRIIEREPADPGFPVVVLAKESDSKKFSPAIREALTKLAPEEKAHRTVIDPRSVGGYSVRADSRIVDRSFRSALVSLYQRAIS